MDDKDRNEQWEAAIPIAKKVSRQLARRNRYIDADELEQELLVQWPDLDHTNTERSFYWAAMKIIRDLDILGMGQTHSVRLEAKRRSEPLGEAVHSSSLGEKTGSVKALDATATTRLADERVDSACVLCGNEVQLLSRCCSQKCNALVNSWKCEERGIRSHLGIVLARLMEGPASGAELKALFWRFKGCLIVLERLGYHQSIRKKRRRINGRMKQDTYYELLTYGVPIPPC